MFSWVSGIAAMVAGDLWINMKPDHVRKAVKAVVPGGVCNWRVIVDGEEYPLKQIVLAVSHLVTFKSGRLTPADFNTYQAKSLLEEMEFDYKYHE